MFKGLNFCTKVLAVTQHKMHLPYLTETYYIVACPRLKMILGFNGVRPLRPKSCHVGPYPVFNINCNQQKMYCAKTIYILKFGFVLSISILPAVISCKISATESK